MAKNITVYTSNNCAYCMMVKKFLTMKGKSFSEINVDEHPDKRQEAVELSGARTVPVTVVVDQNDSKRVTVGYNPSQLAGLIA